MQEKNAIKLPVLFGSALFETGNRQVPAITYW